MNIRGGEQLTMLVKPKTHLDGVRLCGSEADESSDDGDSGEGKHREIDSSSGGLTGQDVECNFELLGM